MKKITFILFALIAGTTFAQESASGEATAFADIVSPITITKNTDLNFGRIANNETGTVVVASDGTYAASSLDQINGGASPTAATFIVNAASGFAYSVTLPSTATLLNGENSLTVNNFTSNAGETPTGNGSDQTVGVGATLNVTTGQPTGVYSGNFEVTVSYE